LDPTDAADYRKLGDKEKLWTVGASTSTANLPNDVVWASAASLATPFAAIAIAAALL